MEEKKSIAICNECGCHIEIDDGEEWAYCPICDNDQVEVVKHKQITDLQSQLAITEKALERENQQLKQQLHDLPKKIVGEIKNNCWYGGALLEDNYYKVTDKLLDTILKKYGGENDL